LPARKAGHSVFVIIAGEVGSVRKYLEYLSAAGDMRLQADEAEGVQREQFLRLANQWETLARHRIQFLELRLLQPERAAAE
jgi:hypothetical protein